MTHTCLMLLGLLAPPQYLKGQLHAHTANSGDSQTPVAEVTRFYAERGYDFLVLTDHNVVTVADAAPEGLLVIPGVELTQNLERCRATSPHQPSGPCLLHANALFLEAPRGFRVRHFSPASGARLERYAAALRWGLERGALVQINHPNFYYAADGPLIAALAGRGARLLEVANEAVDSNNAGDGLRPSTEALWDEALGRGTRIYATATDDAHHYSDAAAVRARGEEAYTGDRGFVMVRAAAKTPAAIKAALSAGRFYASNGITLRAEGLSADGAALIVEVDPGVVGPRVEFIGRGGAILARARGHAARYPLVELPKGGYVRARVTDAAGRRAWTQPAWRPSSP